LGQIARPEYEELQGEETQMTISTDIAEQVPTGFWAIIDGARQDPVRFRHSLKKLDRESLAQLGWTYEELAMHLRSEEHVRHADASLSEDGIAELANWVVALGRERFVEVLAHPERIPARHADSGFMSQIVEEFEERFSEDFPYNDRSWDPDWRSAGKQGPWS
jgi:hypothetical protein